MEIVRQFTYLGDRVNTGGECVAAVTARTRCGWVQLRECGEFHVLIIVLSIRIVSFNA